MARSASLLEVTPTSRAALRRMQAAYTHLALRTTEGLDSERLGLARETLSELQRRLESELPGPAGWRGRTWWRPAAGATASPPNTRPTSR
ncbi:hypothetical protein [Streptomyces flavofungini]|uniref:Uncharacterized protein n=1 Tax=Streptomyces flavofungini TaxID=68200 RepID=A0ABS0X852_9ACTN|nr:hypothetical protein [Streptomyces flavofungini]MBJ3809176.1 hypothetical protein [Streptomyces flavofungini]GHC68945.1 hypothetical protein GCM10010349_43550 [Streptomyces flavofungini]